MTDIFAALVAALGSVRWGASATSTIANLRADSCCNISSTIITIVDIDGEEVLFVDAAVENVPDSVVACVYNIGSVGWGASETSPIVN